MSCVLRIGARDTGLAEHASSLGLAVDSAWGGNRRLADVQAASNSSICGIRIVASAAEFEEYSRQIDDAIRYLAANGDAVKALLLQGDQRRAVLDFGVSTPIDVFRTFELPAGLIALAASIGISLAISPYPSGDSSKNDI
jgi:hypothetical protein